MVASRERHGEVLVSIPDFFAVLPDFSAKSTKFFRKHSKVRKNILSHSRFEGSNLGRRTIVSYKRSYVFKLRRFGGVGAPEGRENVPARCNPIYTIFFRKIYRTFPQNVWQQGKVGMLTCDFLAEVEG